MAVLLELKGRSKETLRSTTGFLRLDLLLGYIILSNMLYLSNIPAACGTVVWCVLASNSAQPTRAEVMPVHR